MRKIDPGEKFPWEKLSKNGLGKWPRKRKNVLKLDLKKIEKSFFKNLKKIGYRYFSIHKRGIREKKVIKSFQQHFLPKNVTGKIDKKTYETSCFLIY